jgi:hypothetical protein
MRRLAKLIVLAVLFSCGKDPDLNKSDPFSNYFPLRVGAFQIYDVEDIQIQQNIQTRSAYELKSVAVDSFRNQENGYTYVINRYKRLDDKQPWAALDTWSIRLNDREIIVSEGNIPFVRLILPIVNRQKWNGNELNTLGGEDKCGTGDAFSCDQFEMDAIGQVFKIGNSSFENTLTVVEHNDPDLLVKNDVRKKVYSSAVGLVYMEKIMLNYCTTPPSCYGKQFVNTGTIYKQILKQHGLEK